MGSAGGCGGGATLSDDSARDAPSDGASDARLSQRERIVKSLDKWLFCCDRAVVASVHVTRLPWHEIAVGASSLASELPLLSPQQVSVEQASVQAKSRQYTGSIEQFHKRFVIMVCPECDTRRY